MANDSSGFNLVSTALSPGIPANGSSLDGGSFARPNVDRALFTVLQANKVVSKRFVMFNPTEISDDKGIIWGSMEIPGASHPVYQYGAGGARTISLELYIDGDRGRFGRQQARDTSSLSIKDELMFYRSLVYPTSHGQQFLNAAPATVLFSWGELYNGVACIVKKAPWHVFHWTPDGKPVRARIPLVLEEIVDSSVPSSVIFPLGGA